MAKGKVTISVEADTSKASAAINKLKKDAESGNGLKGFGDSLKKLDDFVPGMDRMSGAFGTIQKMAGLANPAVAGIAAAGAGVKLVVDQFREMAQVGGQAAEAVNKVATELEVIDKNIGGSGLGLKEFAEGLYHISANGVNSMSDLSDAAKVLHTAFSGDTARTREMIAVFDDLAAGTGVNVSEWASMAAEVENTGVSIKDVTKLSNRGIPIFQALGKVIGTSAEEAEAAAKAGLVTAQQMMETYKVLGENYTGMSSSLSSRTLEGAQSSYDAAMSAMYSGSGEGYRESRIEFLNEESNKMLALAKDPVWQELQKSAGQVAASLDNLGDKSDRYIKEGVQGFAMFLSDLKVGYGLWGKTEKEKAEEAADEKVATDIVKGYEAAMEGKMGPGQVAELIESFKYANFDKISVSADRVEGMVEELENLLSLQKGVEEQRTEINKLEARDAAKRNAAMKYGTIDQKLKALGGQVGGLPVEATRDDLRQVVESIRKSLIEGTAEDMQEAEKALSILTPVLREIEVETEKAAREEQKLADAREKAADAARRAEQEETNAYIKTKGGLMEKVNKAQEDYDKRSNELQKFYEEQRMRNEEEAQGIYRDKWKGMDIAYGTSKESELLDAQQKAADALAEANKNKREFEENYKKFRDNMENWVKAITWGGHALNTRPTTAITG